MSIYSQIAAAPKDSTIFVQTPNGELQIAITPNLKQLMDTTSQEDIQEFDERTRRDRLENRRERIERREDRRLFRKKILLSLLLFLDVFISVVIYLYFEFHLRYTDKLKGDWWRYTLPIGIFNDLVGTVGIFSENLGLIGIFMFIEAFLGFTFIVPSLSFFSVFHLVITLITVQIRASIIYKHDRAELDTETYMNMLYS
eukprot:TRINITY_DN8259_c0_g1_i1.p1 TRINITY_DN8259_c0_g1~~TRINITY_DN8259_c0_g1_i1.p1  ORF type:complete len:199 (-),score=50.83 TRINITY_DN8259_c0_g1_i1:60-656(-)